MKELREQLTKIILKYGLSIHESYRNKGDEIDSYDCVNQILSIPIETPRGKLWMENRCIHKKEVLNPIAFSGSSQSADFGGITWCSTCQGTGIIRREAFLQDYLNLFDFVKNECISCEGRLLPDGSKLVWEEK